MIKKIMFVLTQNKPKPSFQLMLQYFFDLYKNKI
jgi:hypothetical protein